MENETNTLPEDDTPSNGNNVETESTESTNATDPVTDPKATIKIEGQTFDLDAALALEDRSLKVVLQPHFASIENANVTREVKDGKLSVTIVKRAQHKGYAT